MSLYRLIDLAKKTGDRLIVHDPLNDRDIVIMDIDSYEALVDGQQRRSKDRLPDDEDDFGIREPWEDGIKPTLAPWDEPSPWHHAGSVLADRYADDMTDMDLEDGVDAQTDLFDGDERSAQPQLQSTQQLVTPRADDAAKETWEEEPLPADEPVFYEEPV